MNGKLRQLQRVREMTEESELGSNVGVWMGAKFACMLRFRGGIAQKALVWGGAFLTKRLGRGLKLEIIKSRDPIKSAKAGGRGTRVRKRTLRILIQRMGKGKTWQLGKRATPYSGRLVRRREGIEGRLRQ